jgi:hypothetical protein
VWVKQWFTHNKTQDIHTYPHLFPNLRIVLNQKLTVKNWLFVGCGVFVDKSVENLKPSPSIRF